MIIVFASSVSATGFVLPGTSRLNTTVYDDWDSPDTFGVMAAVDTSIYCRGIPATGLDQIVFTTSSFSLLPSGSSGPTIYGRGDSDGNAAAGAAIAFTADATGSYTLAISSSSSGTGTASAAKGTISCHNTTLYGNFNTITAANPVNYLELKNISTSSVIATVILKTTTGTQISRFNVTLAAGERRDLAIHDVSGASNTFGSIQVPHNGALGAIVGNVSKYLISGSSVVITATEPLSPRVQN